jgi:hypothetical protein
MRPEGGQPPGRGEPSTADVLWRGRPAARTAEVVVVAQARGGRHCRRGRKGLRVVAAAAAAAAGVAAGAVAEGPGGVAGNPCRGSTLEASWDTRAAVAWGCGGLLSTCAGGAVLSGSLLGKNFGCAGGRLLGRVFAL